MAEFEYRVGPGSGEWISYPELVKLLRAWDGVPKETGFPSITISKRLKADDQGAVLARRLRELMAAEEADLEVKAEFGDWFNKLTKDSITKLTEAADSGKCDCGNAGCAELYYDDELD